MNKTNPIVVTWDFTEISGYALEHAIKIARTVNEDIILLHVIDKNESPGVVNARKEKLKALAEKTSKDSGLDITFRIARGKIFAEIGDFADEHEASMVIMGTHGVRGMQKLTGSWALKVILKSNVPFIVVQDKPAYDEKVNNIVFSVNFRSENKQKVNMAIFMGKYFDSKIHIIKQEASDKSLRKKLNINLTFAAKLFAQNNIDYEIHELPRGDLGKQTIEYAQSINADMIVIVTKRGLSMAAMGTTEQYIIANSSKIPVCCVNPLSSSVSGGFAFAKG